LTGKYLKVQTSRRILVELPEENFEILLGSKQTEVDEGLLQFFMVENPAVPTSVCTSESAQSPEGHPSTAQRANVASRRPVPVLVVLVEGLANRLTGDRG